MLQSFIIILREGFESFLLVAVIFSYLRKSGQRRLAPAVYWAIGVALAVSGGLGYLLFQMQTGHGDWIEQHLGQGPAGFLGNEALREAILGSIAILMVASLVVYMWRTGPKLKQKMEERLGEVSDHHPGRNGNVADVAAGTQSASVIRRAAGIGGCGRDGLGVGPVRTPD